MATREHEDQKAFINIILPDPDIIYISKHIYIYIIIIYVIL